VKYHQFHEAKGAIMLLDPGHAEMEQFVVSGMMSIIKHDDTLKTLTIIGSEVHTSPIHYA
jgi:putative NIF3 family GTP cyclohydrolase 1 type 2